MSETKLEMSLLENAFDFLEEAAKRIERAETTASTTNYKYAILHLASAIELILKQKVWQLEGFTGIVVQSNSNKKQGITQENLEAGLLRTIYLDDAIEKLKMQGVVFDVLHEDILAKLKKQRNQIEHYSVSIDKPQAALLMVKTWSFVVDFVATELRKEPFLVIKLNDISQMVESQKIYVDHRLAEIESDLEQLKHDDVEMRTCFNCGQPTMPYRGAGLMECLFCRAGVVI